MRVTDIVTPSNGCSTTTTFTITNTPAVVTIDNLDITLGHQSNCSPVNGSATVNEITVNGTGAGNTTGYTFKWFQSNGTTVIPGSGTAATIAVPLAAGSYFVQATNTATNCKSANTPFTINDTHVNPVVAAADDNQQYQLYRSHSERINHDKYRWSCSCSRTIQCSMVRRKWNDDSIGNNCRKCNRSKQ